MKHYEHQATNLALGDDPERHDWYAVAIPEARVNMHYATFIGAIYLGVATDGTREVQQQLYISEGLRNIQPPGSDELKSCHQSVIRAGEGARSQSAELTEYQTEVTESACHRLDRAGSAVLGGIALFKQRDKYAAGIFYSLKLAQEGSNTVSNLRREQTQTREANETIPDGLAAMTALFAGLDTKSEVEAFAITNARSVVAQLYAEAATQPQEVPAHGSELFRLVGNRV